MKILNLHGLYGEANNTNAAFLRQFDEFEIVSPQMNLETANPVDLMQTLLANNCDAVVGNSFGGFYAYVVGSIKNIPTFLVNPCIPSHEYIPNLASDYSYNELLEKIWKLYKNCNEDVTLFIGIKDDIIDHKKTLKEVNWSKLYSFKEGHRLHSEEYLDTLKKELEKLV